MQRKHLELNLQGLVLVALAGAWLAGIVLSAWLPLSTFALFIGSCLSTLLLIPLWRQKSARLSLLLVLSLLLGAWRYAITLPTNDVQAISHFIGVGSIRLRGSITDEPKLTAKSGLLQISISSISRNSGASWQDAHGQVEVEALASEVSPPYGPKYGDSVEVQGKLQAATAFNPPGTFASMVFPRISVTGTGGIPLLGALYQLRARLATIIEQSLPQPEAALLIALLLSQHTPTLKVLVPVFNETGTAHLIAPSGFKVTVLAGLVAAITRKIGPTTQKVGKGRLLPAQRQKKERWRWLPTVLTSGSIVVYTLLSGAGPAALRAGIMGIIVLVAPRFHRHYNVYTALAWSALLLSIFDPYIMWDAGFQLSFLGTLGIVLLTPIFQKWLHFLERVPGGHVLNEITAVTLAAQIATLPLLAVDFHQVSLIAPVANILTVPLLGVLIGTGLLVCGAGLLAPQFGIICGWLAWPLLWYLIHAVIWCSTHTYAYLTVTNLSNGLAWCYYGVVALLASFIFYKWPSLYQAHQGQAVQPLMSRRTWRLLQLSAALLVLLATGATALAARPDGRLTITFLSVGPAGQGAQGEAILLHTPDGKNALIDGGSDATSLGQELDSRLPSWQHSLDAVILTSTKADHLAGLQDVVSRYQISEVMDAGMLHPNAAYGLWRRTIAERNLPYTQIRQGTTIALGTQVALQILWPQSPLHKGSNEEADNGLIIRLISPGLSMLLLGAAAFSTYALHGLSATITSDYLRADIVQVVSEVGKRLPAALRTILQLIKPSQVIITPAALSSRQRKAGLITAILNPLPPELVDSSWQTVQTAQVGTLEITAGNQGWSLNVYNE